jgi:hypothetical protein
VEKMEVREKEEMHTPELKYLLPQHLELAPKPRDEVGRCLAAN